jgi:hypothetical protein
MVFSNCSSLASRSDLFEGGSLLVENDGLHGMVEKCGSKPLSSGLHSIYIVGFQGRGGVGMKAKYSGPDTGGVKVLLTGSRVSSLFYPACAPDASGGSVSVFSMCMFRSSAGLDRTPRIGDDVAAGRLKFVGRGVMPVIDMHKLETFREYVPGTPDSNYVWSISGQLKIGSSGSYNLCITSDDGWVTSLYLYNNINVL